MCGADYSEKRPIFDKPLAAYVIKLTAPAYLLAVETERDMRLGMFFYNSFEQAAGNRHIPESAETYFGKIDNWQEFPEPPSFSKKIYGI